MVNGNGTVSVIDIATDTVTTTINGGGMASQRVAFTPDGAYAYVVNQNSHDVTVIETATYSVVTTIPVGRN